MLVSRQFHDSTTTVPRQYHDRSTIVPRQYHDSTDCITAAPRQLKYSIKSVVNMDYNKIGDVLC